MRSAVRGEVCVCVCGRWDHTYFSKLELINILSFHSTGMCVATLSSPAESVTRRWRVQKAWWVDTGTGNTFFWTLLGRRIWWLLTCDLLGFIPNHVCQSSRIISEEVWYPHPLYLLILFYHQTVCYICHTPQTSSLYHHQTVQFLHFSPSNTVSLLLLSSSSDQIIPACQIISDATHANLFHHHTVHYKRNEVVG